jgi:uncharacterized RDD family membrane protein YckC
VDDPEGTGPGEPTPPVGRELHQPPGDARSGPGRFAAPAYAGTEYGAPQYGAPQYGTPAHGSTVPVDQPYDRSQYGHYDGQPYVPVRGTNAKKQLLPLPDGVEYASWGSRFAAFLVDVVALSGCIVPALVARAVVDSTVDAGPDRSALGAVIIGAVYLGSLAACLYQMTWRQGARGQSWGKQLMRIHLVRADDVRPPGGLVGIARYLVRSTFATVTGGIYTIVTALWPLADVRMQTLDDKLVNTLVVRLPRQRGRH